MMIGQLKEGAIALAGDHGQQPTHLVLREKDDLRERCGVLAWPQGSDSIAVLSDSGQRT